ncbi:MAG: ABC-2 type transport system permease protein [Clostridium sp.]|jgi:ABC-2 type transport system permease protein
MKYKMLFFNKGVLKNDLKRFSWIGILYSLFLLFAFPLQILMSRRYATKDKIISTQYMFDFNDILIFSMLIVPVITAMFLFRYIQNKNSIDMLHSLPIKRVSLYDNHVFFGIMTLIIPVIVTTIISCILKNTLNLNDSSLHFTYNQIFVWSGTTILMSVFIFLLCVLIGILTGLSTAQGLLTYIFLFLPAGLGILIVDNLNLFLFGFDFSNNIFVDISPFERMISNKPLRIAEILIYIFSSIFIYALGRFSYVKRDLEAATNAVAFKTLQPIFKYGVTFCTTLIGGLVFTDGQEGLSWAILGYIIGGLIGYYIAEMIIKKSIKIFKNIKGYLIYAGIFSIILLCVNFDITGFEKRIPDITKIKSICFSTGAFPQNNNSEKYIYYEKENLEKIKILHNKIVDNKKNIKNSSSMSIGFSIKYNLKNGKQIERQYYVLKEPLDDFLKPIYESKEYKKINFDYLKTNANNVDKITISSLNKSKNLTLTNPTEINEVVDILKTITLNKTYEEMKDIRQPWGSIVLLMSNDQKINLSFLKTNSKLEKWLLDKKLLKNAIIMPEDINHILVAKRVNGRIETIASTDVKKLKITDKTKIEACMQNSCDEYTNNNNIEYDMEITPKNIAQAKFTATFDEKHAPNFVVEYFK